MRAQAFGPPGGRRFKAAYASRAAPAAAAPADTEAINRTLLICWPFSSSTTVGVALGDAVGVGAGLGAMAVAPLAVNP